MRVRNPPLAYTYVFGWSGLKQLADLLADGGIGRIGQLHDFPVKKAVHQDCGLELPVGALVSAAAICPQGRGGADGTGDDTPL